MMSSGIAASAMTPTLSFSIAPYSPSSYPSNNLWYKKIRSSGTVVTPIRGNVNVDIKLVGGGGAGGYMYYYDGGVGGGGGAGGILESNTTLIEGQTYVVYTGAGGAVTYDGVTAPASGAASTFSQVGGGVSLTANGGGNGGATLWGNQVRVAPSSGGSGGGGGGNSTTGANGTDAQGNRGGDSATGYSGGAGGGGKSSNGSNYSGRYGGFGGYGIQIGPYTGEFEVGGGGGGGSNCAGQDLTWSGYNAIHGGGGGGMYNSTTNYGPYSGNWYSGGGGGGGSVNLSYLSYGAPGGSGACFLIWNQLQRKV